LLSTFDRIKEIKSQIDSNDFSIQYAKQQIQVKRREIEVLEQDLDEDLIKGGKYSKQIE
jgi:hypothetical protein